MTIRLLATSLLGTSDTLQVGGQPVQQRHADLVSLTERLGLRDRLMFAEPIVTWPTSGQDGKIAWYADTQEEPVPLTSMAGHHFEKAAALLRLALAVILNADLDTTQAKFLRAACVVPGLDSVRIDGELIVLLNWGIASRQDDGQSLDFPVSLAKTPLAPFLPAPSVVQVPIAPLPGPKGDPSASPHEATTIPPPLLDTEVPEKRLTAPRDHGWETFPWHAVVAVVFVLLGFLAGVRLMGLEHLAAPLGLAGW